MSTELIIWSLCAASIATGLVGGVFLSIFIVLLIGMTAISAAIGIAAYIWPPTVGAAVSMALAI